MTSDKGSAGPASFGEYLCLADAASLIGDRLVGGWSETDLLFLDSDVESDERDRAQRVRAQLVRLLSGGQIPAYGLDEENAYTELNRTRLSKPFFTVNIVRSLFQWAPGEWAEIFVSKRGLNHYLAEISDIRPRKSLVFDWQEITSKAWKLALSDPALWQPNRLIGAVQDAFVGKYDGRPDEKELRGLANDIIDHLSRLATSREVSSFETPSDSHHA